MILEVEPDLGRIVHHRNAVLQQLLRRADARQHQELRARERAGAQHDFRARTRDPLFAVARLVTHADRRAVLEHDARDERVGFGRQQRIALDGGEIRRGGAAAPAFERRRLIEADACL